MKMMRVDCVRYVMQIRPQTFSCLADISVRVMYVPRGGGQTVPQGVSLGVRDGVIDMTSSRIINN